MSQEEEKLIEEFENKVLYELPFGDHGSLYTTASELICKFWIPKISEAYRSGKLAGFEMCEKLSKPFIQTLFNETENSSTKGLIMLGNCAKQTLSLIEEEKKKL